MRLFVAVWPTDEVLDAVAALPRPAHPGLRWTTRDQWHVTLRFLGSVEDVDGARAALCGVAAAAADVEVGPEVGRFGRRILHVPTAGLDAIAAATVQAMRNIGEPSDPRPFHGHLTLARSGRGGADLRALAGAPISGRWRAREVTLVRSHLGGGVGARYEVIERVPLT